MMYTFPSWGYVFAKEHVRSEFSWDMPSSMIFSSAMRRHSFQYLVILFSSNNAPMDPLLERRVNMSFWTQGDERKANWSNFFPRSRALSFHVAFRRSFLSVPTLEEAGILKVKSSQVDKVAQMMDHSNIMMMAPTTRKSTHHPFKNRIWMSCFSIIFNQT